MNSGDPMPSGGLALPEGGVLVVSPAGLWRDQVIQELGGGASIL